MGAVGTPQGSGGSSRDSVKLVELVELLDEERVQAGVFLDGLR